MGPCYLLPYKSKQLFANQVWCILEPQTLEAEVEGTEASLRPAWAIKAPGTVRPCLKNTIENNKHHSLHSKVLCPSAASIFMHVSVLQNPYLTPSDMVPPQPTMDYSFMLHSLLWHPTSHRRRYPCFGLTPGPPNGVPFQPRWRIHIPYHSSKQ